MSKHLDFPICDQYLSKEQLAVRQVHRSENDLNNFGHDPLGTPKYALQIQTLQPGFKPLTSRTGGRHSNISAMKIIINRPLMCP